MWAALQAKAREAHALVRSVRVYHGDRSRHQRMDELYARFLKPGSLAFDIGSHVGDRVSSFRRLGARVVAAEPQPGPARVIGLIHGRDRDVTLVRKAVGASEGEIVLRLNSANPTVSTASGAFVDAASGAGGWEGQVWDREVTVPMTTLDRLIAEHGRPDFVKVDVEGFEDAVLAGLTQPVPALSFEITTIARDVAYRCLDRLATLGPYRFDIAMGESQRLVLGEPVDPAAMADLIGRLPHACNSGDVYAVLPPAT